MNYDIGTCKNCGTIAGTTKDHKCEACGATFRGRVCEYCGTPASDSNTVVKRY